MARIRLGLCQLNTVVGDLDGNVERILAAYDEAEAAGCDVAVFPELAITGYPPEDLVLKPGFVAANRAALDKVAARTGRCAAVVGFVDADRDLYNAAAVCAGGEVVGHATRSACCPTTPCSTSSATSPPARRRSRSSRSPGCGWAWRSARTSGAPRAPSRPSRPGGAELVVIPNGSPYFEGRHAERERMVATRAEDAHCHIAYVNQVGGQDELIFDGASFVVDDNGELVHRMPQLHEAIDVVDLDIRPVFRTRLLDPRGRDTAPALPVVPRVDRPSPTTPATPGRPPCTPCSRRSTRCTTRWCWPRATTSPRTASPTSCSGSPAASTRRWSP